MEQDEYLLTFHPFGLAELARHIGRTSKAAESRLNRLTKTGARREFGLSKVHELNFRRLAGHPENTGADRAHWLKESEL